MNKNNKKPRIAWIDNAKGIAILLVIIGHTTSNLTGFFSTSFVYGIHLVMFFLLSGYTIRPQKLSREYINTRFRRLMVPYFATCLAILLMDIFNARFLYNDISIANATRIAGMDLMRSFFASGAYTFFGTIDLGTRIGAIWFLPAMFFANLAFQVILGYSKEDDVRMGCISTLIAVVGYLTARFLWLPFSIQSGALAVPFLWLGYEIRKCNCLEKLRWHHYLVALLILIYGIHAGFCNIGFVTASINDLLLSIPVGLSGCLLIYLVSKANKSGKILPIIGRESLLILCTHLFILATYGLYIQKWLEPINLSGNSYVWTRGLINILLAVLFAIIVKYINKGYLIVRNKMKSLSFSSGKGERELVIDITKGILIISMVVGHFDIDPLLRKIIYSCHMIGFVFLYGYFYRKPENLLKNILHMCRTMLIPYFLCMLIEIAMNLNQISYEYLSSVFKRYLCGYSFTKILAPDAPSIGPVYFILLLFCTRLIYMVIDRISLTVRMKAFFIICASLIGMHLGNAGYWLPWSFDVACYAIIFYALGAAAKKYDVLSYVKKNHILYFALSPVWVYMIYVGSMEIAVRRYNQYGLVVIGSLCGVLLIYKLSCYIADHLILCSIFLRLAGQYSLYILILHKLFSGYVIRWTDKIGLLQGYLWNMIAAIGIQVCAGILIGCLKSIMKNRPVFHSSANCFYL